MQHSESQDPDPEPKLKTEMLFGIRYNEYGSTSLEIILHLTDLIHPNNYSAIKWV
jgi:hypothetical protein